MALRRNALGVPSITLSLLLAAPPASAQQPPASAEQPPASADPAEATAANRDGRRSLGRLPANLARGFAAPWSKASVLPLLAGVAATGIGTAYDLEVRDAIASGNDKGAQAVDVGFGPLVSGSLVLGIFAAGRHADGQRFRDMSYDLLVASLVTQGYTLGIKAVAGRERPNGEDNASFPSGHTSNAWAIASVLDGHYGKRVAIPAYAVAALVGVGRMRGNHHWLSDVLAGATLGFIGGHSVVRANSRPTEAGLAEGRRAKLWVAPVLGPSRYGVAVSGSF